MLSARSRMLIQSIRIYAGRPTEQKLVRFLDKIHNADLGLILGHLKKSDVHKVFSILLKDIERAAEVLTETETELAVEILEEMDPKQISSLLQEMYSDDSAQILERFNQELKEQVLQEMNNLEQAELEERLVYDEETAGRIMVPDFFSLPPETTVRDTIKALQKGEDLEIIYYIYVTSEDGRLVGVTSLRQLLLVPPETCLRDIMESEVIVVNSHADQEDVARMVARYNLLAIPVVDDLGKLMGIVTVDDVIDIIKDEATEDMFKMAGAVGADDKVVTGGVFSNVKVRWPWLLASWCGGMTSFYVTGHFNAIMMKFMILAQFIPLVMGMGGNVGTQSSIIIVRGLATRLIDSSDVWRIFLREIRISAILGTLYGILLASLILALFYFGIIPASTVPSSKLAFVVGFGVFCSMQAAAILGTFTPILLDRIHIDPAIATGPMVTSSIDIFGILVYFSISSALLF